MQKYSSYTQKISAFFQKNKRMPSYSEILKLTGLKSKNSAFGLVKAMVEDNLVVKDAFGKLAPGHRLTQLPLLGIVEAGFPTYAEESIADTLSLDDFLVKKLCLKVNK